MSEVHGPIDYVLLEFPGDRLTGNAPDAILDLVDRGIVRIYDILVLRKSEDGTVSNVALDGSENDRLGGFAAFAGARSGMLNADDEAEAGAAVNPGTIAVVIVYENSWAIPFVAAALDVGGALVAGSRIPAPDVMAALDALDASS
jgi:hypothetical protein